MNDTDNNIIMENLTDDYDIDPEITEHEESVKTYYNADDFISGPKRAENGTIPLDILEFHHSFGYDTRKYFNLCVINSHTLIFASGNMIHFLDLLSSKIWFRRCSSGGGIGCIVKNPTNNHVAVAENGTDPPIIIYEYPSMEIVTILFQGTTKRYFRLSYSLDGSLLVSQGGYPDYLITIWQWQESKILLQCKSHENIVYNVLFNSEICGHLVTSGVEHIKFWTMPYTFTGLKLKGDIGRFDKTQICDIISLYPMAHDKIVSGCEWGNILVWENGLIKVEVCRRNKVTCHAGPITHFEFINGELLSIGKDGWIRSWFYEIIDLADPPEENRLFEVQPTCEFFISENINKESSMLMYIQKKEDNENDTFWYAQDGNGGIWLLDLNTHNIPDSPKKVFISHGGSILDMDVTTCGPFVATIGDEGHLHIYNYLSKRLILVQKFNDSSSRVICLPYELEMTGSTLLCGFKTGVIRLITIALEEADKVNNINGDYVRLIQVLKPHTLPIVAMSLSNSYKILITSSEDRTVFAFSIKATDKYPQLIPIGYIKIPAIVTCLTWKPKGETTILLGCTEGYCVENEFPSEPQSYTTTSYELIKCKPRIFRFHSIKSFIQREKVRLEIEEKKQKKRAEKYERLEQLRIENPGIEIDEETFLADPEEYPPLPEIYIPEIPNRVLMILYTAYDTVLLSMAGFDAGYMYEYPNPKSLNVKKKEPINSFPVYDAMDTEIVSYLFYDDHNYIFLGMQHGEIRICKLKPKDYTDFSDYWILPMHDHFNGYIPKILLSYDHTMLLTCGHDGNIFSFTICDEMKKEQELPKVQKSFPLPESNVEDITIMNHPSIEEVIVNMENNRILEIAKEKKNNTLKIIEQLTADYDKILIRNNSLIKSQQIPQEEFELDPRITTDLNMQIKAEIDLVYTKLAFKVEKSKLRLQKLFDYFIEPITCLPFAVRRILKPNTMVYSLRERKLGDEFNNTYSKVIHQLGLDKQDRKRMYERELGDVNEEEKEQEKFPETESFLKGITYNVEEHRLGIRINQMLRKYRARVNRIRERQKQWKIIKAKEPDPNAVHPEDEIAIDIARNNIGNYELKTSPKFHTLMEEQNATLLKYKQLLDSRKRLHNLRETFNSKLKSVRTEKEKLQVEVKYLIQVLEKIHAEIPQSNIKPLPIIPTFDEDIEFPEQRLKLVKSMETSLDTDMTEKIIQDIKKKFSNPFDDEYEVLLLNETQLHINQRESIAAFLSSSDEKFKGESDVNIDVLQSLYSSDHTENVWEREMKRFRMQKKIYEQDCILNYIQSNYEELDKELDILEQERLTIITESTYMELFILTLHQELCILKDYEDMENELRGKVHQKTEEHAAMKQEIQNVMKKIDDGNKEILALQEKIKRVSSDYLSMISENKFCKFLRKIFRKKKKPPKDEDASGTSSSSSSDSTSEEDDNRSIDSKELEIIHLDESICPPGCDKEFYAKAFVMREERYSYEHKIIDIQRNTEILTKTSETYTRQLKVIESTLKMNQSELEAYMLEKQQKLNNIDMTIILTCDQLQHFTDTENVAKICNCLLFDKAKLSQLYSRIQELKSETISQREKHKENRTHLTRLEADLKFMEDEIKTLKSCILEEVIKKFGQKIPISTLYEIVLRRMIYNIKPDLINLTRIFEKQIKCVQEKYDEELDILKNLMRDNTEKLSFLTILEEEKLKLKKLLQHTPMSEEQMAEIEEKYKKDLQRLSNIIKNQHEQKQLLCNDIKNLSLKSRLLPPIDVNKKLMYNNIENSNRQEDYETNIINTEEISETDQSEIFNSENLNKTQDCLKKCYLMQKVMEQLSNENILLEKTEKEKIIQIVSKELLANLPEDSDLDEINIIIEEAIQKIIANLPTTNEQTVPLLNTNIQENLNYNMRQ